MRKKLWRTFVTRFALLLMVAISALGVSAYTHTSAHAATQPIFRTETDPITSTVVFDAEGDTIAGSLAPTIDIGGIFPLPFAIKGSISYTLDVPTAWYPPMLPQDYYPAIRNIRQNVYVVGGQTPNLPFGFQVSTAVEVYSGDGTFLKTITGTPTDIIHNSNDIDYELQDTHTIATTIPYQLYSSNFIGPRSSNLPGPASPVTTLFFLRHIVHVVADAGYQLNITPSTPFTYRVNSPG